MDGPPPPLPPLAQQPEAGPSSGRPGGWDDKGPPPVRHRVGKTSTAACGPCKRAHLACDDGRPCKRCSTLNREDQCVDVPQKKRGRPKLAQTAGGAASASARSRPKGAVASSSASATVSPAFQPMDPSSAGRHSPRSIHPYPLHRSTLPSAPGPSPYSMFPSDFSLAAPSPPPEPPSTQRILTIFTTMDFTMIRSSESSSRILGRPSGSLRQQWLGSLLSQEDVQALEPDRQWLVTALSSGFKLATSMEAAGWIEQSSESMLESPAAGTTFPARDVSIRRVDGSWEDFNLRMHIGQGAGLDLRNPDTYSRAYLVISLLAIRPSSPFPASRGSGQPSHATASPPPPPQSRRTSSPARAPLANPLEPIPPPSLPPNATSPTDTSFPTTTLPPISTLTSAIDRYSPHHSRPSTGHSSGSSHTSVVGQLFRPSFSPTRPAAPQLPRPITSDGLARPFSAHSRPGGQIHLPAPFVVPYTPDTAHGHAHHHHPYARPSTGYSSASASSHRKDSVPPTRGGLHSYAARGSFGGSSSISGASSYDPSGWREDMNSRGSEFGWGGSRPGTGASTAGGWASGGVGPASGGSLSGAGKTFGGFSVAEGPEGAGGLSAHAGGPGRRGSGVGGLPSLSSLFSYTPPPPGPSTPGGPPPGPTPPPAS